MILLSGNLVADWSIGFGGSQTYTLYIGCDSLDSILDATHSSVAYAIANKSANELCRMKFAAPVALPVAPDSCVVSAISGSGWHDTYFTAALYSGAYVCADAESQYSVQLVAQYGGETVKTITGYIKDPGDGTAASSVSYTVIADGVTLSSGSVTPSDDAITVDINIAVMELAIVFEATNGKALISNWLPTTTSANTTYAASGSKGLVLGPYDGTALSLDSVLIIENSYVGYLIAIPT